jgi:hypothetical protein
MWIVASIVIGQLVWSVVLKTHAQEVAAYGRFETSAGWQTGLIFASALLMIVIQFILARKLGEINIAAAGIVFYLLTWLVVYLVLDYDNPFSTPSIALPLLGSVIGMGVLLFLKNPVVKLILLSFCAFIMLVLIIPNLWLGSYTAEDAWIPVLVTSVTLCLFTP